MNHNEKADPITNGKKIGIIVFLLIIFLPTLLSGVGNFIGKNFDVELKGYTDAAEKPELTADNFLNSSFQNAYTAWFDTNLKPRGVFTKTYTTIRYNLFNLGNRPIGYNKDIYEPSYIESELALSSTFDMSLEQNGAQMEAYVEKLELLQDKLAEFGKYLYVYIPANKANMHPENIPEKYIAMADPDAVNPTDYFFELLRETTIPYLDTAEIGRSLEYPAFYPTGIHWSRPFEQTVSQRILSDLKEMTGKNYREMQFGEIKESAVPFWRDTDVFDLLNVWNTPDITYYEYFVEPIIPEEFDRLGVLLSGTSFGLGFRSDLLSVYPTEEFYLVNRSEYFLKPNGEMQMINGDWDTLDLTEYLDKIDIVVIENIAQELVNSSYGFVEYLLETLETYTPGEKSSMLMFDGSSDAALDGSCINGFLGKEDGFAWVKRDSAITLQDAEITKKGLQMNFDISSWIIEQYGEQNVHVYVNGKKVFNRQYDAHMSDSVVIPPDMLVSSEYGDNIYDISVLCSNSFVPKELGINEDTRELALMFTYIGRAK